MDPSKDSFNDLIIMAVICMLAVLPLTQQQCQSTCLQFNFRLRFIEEIEDC